MSDMLKITSASTANTYSNNAKQPLPTTMFNISDLSQVIKTNDRSEDFRQTNNSFEGDNNTALLSRLKLSEDSSFTLNLLKEIFSNSQGGNVANSPDASAKEFNEFVKNVFLSGENLAKDLLAQEKGVTSFRGEFFTLLKDIFNGANGETKNSVVAFLRNYASLCSQDEILNSVSTNLKFLAELMSKNSVLSEKLSDLSQLFLEKNASVNFNALKNDALALLESCMKSLIASDKTNDVASLIKYNLSRFNDNVNPLKQNYSALLEKITDPSVKEMFKNMFEKFVEGSKIPYPTKDALLVENSNYINTDKAAFMLKEILLKNPLLSQSTLLSTLEEKAMQDLANFESLSFEEKQALVKAILNPEMLEKSANAFLQVDSLSENELISINQGNKMLKDMLVLLAGGENSEIDVLLKSFSETSDLNSLIDRIRFILSSVKDDALKMVFADKFNKVLTLLSQSPDVAYQKPNSFENLVDFMTKALGNSNMKYLGIVDPNVLVQNMLTAPGVFTPLMHFVLPLQIDDMRTFGELWVDKDEENGNGLSEGKGTHMFLSFDIENKGFFELEIYVNKKDISLDLACPEEFVKPLSSLRYIVNDTAMKKGYYIKSTSVKKLIKARNLTDVFDVVKERREGLNVKV